MCSECHKESDDKYSGDSIEEMRTKSTRSVINRHPELGLEPEDVSVRFAPKAEEACVHVSENNDTARLEIHIPSYMAQAMSGSPPLSQIALAAWTQTNKSYKELTSCLSIRSRTRFDGVFVSEAPPVRASRAEEAHQVIEYEQSLRKIRD